MPVSFVGNAVQFLLFLISFYLIRKEPVVKNKFIFLNFALFFLFSVFYHLYNFIGPQASFFTSEPFARFYYFQYVGRAGNYLFLSIAIVYLVIDFLFRDFKVYQKYLFTLAIVLGFFIHYYHPYFQNPKYLYQTGDIQDYKVLYAEWSKYLMEHNTDPSALVLAQNVNLQAWRDETPIGDLYFDQKVKRIEELYPYLVADNYLVLLWRPMHYNVIYMNVLCIFFMFLYFGYQYRNDPPQGAYIEKIMFLFLMFCSMEILHAWGYIKSVEWSTFTEIFSIGQYLTIGILLLMVMFFGLRLRFITSVKGEFYELELVHNAQHVTRWRDWVDNVVVHYFLNPKALRGRLFALRPEDKK